MKEISRWFRARWGLCPAGRLIALVALVAACSFAITAGVLGAGRTAVITPASGPRAGPLVRCEPASVSGEVADTLTVDLYVQDVAGLYGADLQLSFDATIGQVVDEDPAMAGVQIQPLNAFLKPDFILFQDADNTSGDVHYAVTQLNPSEPAAGSGSLARFRLQALRAGSFTMLFTRHDLSSREGVPIANETQSCPVTFGAPPPTETATPTPTPTATSSPTPEDTPASTPTASATPTGTPTSTPTASSTPTATATATGSPTPSRTRTPTPTPTLTPTATSTATATPSATVSPTSSATATSTVTSTSTSTQTWTPTETATPTASPEPTRTPTRTPSPDPTWTPTPEPSPTPTPSPEPTATSTGLPMPTSTASPTATSEPTPTPTAAPVTITASVFLDLDRDGSRDEGEPGIGGVTLWVQRLDDERDWRGITDHRGICQFVGLPAGSTYAVEEIDLPGYASTTPDLVFVPVPWDAAGQTFTVWFGDWLVAAGRLYLPMVLN